MVRSLPPPRAHLGRAGRRLRGGAVGEHRGAGRGHVPRAGVGVRRARIPHAEALPGPGGAGAVRGRPVAGEPGGVRERARGDGAAAGRVGGREVRSDSRGR